MKHIRFVSDNAMVCRNVGRLDGREAIKLDVNTLDSYCCPSCDQALTKHNARHYELDIHRESLMPSMIQYLPSTWEDVSSPSRGLLIALSLAVTAWMVFITVWLLTHN